MAAPNPHELEQLPKFLKSLEDLNLKEQYKRNVFLVQWIRARDGNLANAETMLRLHLKWREENEIDKILEWTYPPVFSTLCKIQFLGYDKENSPVIWMPFGTWNLRQIVALKESDNFIKYADWLFESTKAYMKDKTTSSGYPVTQFVFIVDYDKLSLRTLASFGAVQMCLTMVKRFEANHPESLKSAYLINAGRVFEAFFAMIKPLLTDKTAGKLVFLKSNADAWKNTLSKEIPDDVLPVRYGGCNKILEEEIVEEEMVEEDLEEEIVEL